MILGGDEAGVDLKPLRLDGIIVPATPKAQAAQLGHSQTPPLRSVVGRPPLQEQDPVAQALDLRGDGLRQVHFIRVEQGVLRLGTKLSGRKVFVDLDLVRLPAV